MSSEKHCCVPECKDSGDAVLHRFPNPEKDRLRFNTWLYSVGSDILGLENAHIYKYRRVCHRHFENKYLCRNNRISNIAVPTLYLPGFNLVSQPKLPCVGRKPLQGLVIQPIPSTSTAPESHQQFYTSTRIVENRMQKENIDPEAVVCEQVPPSTFQSNEQNLVSDMVCQQIPQTTPQIKKSVLKDLDRKISTRTLKLSRAERNLQLQIITARRKINKLKNKVKKQTAEVTAAKKFVANPAVLDVLQNCSSTAKLLMRIQWREDKKKG